MLILTRKKNETIVLPELGIVIHVVSVQGDRTRIGVEADPSIKILRGELLDESGTVDSGRK